MADSSASRAGVLDEVIELIAQLEGFYREYPALADQGNPLPSLLDQCEALCLEAEIRVREPVRTVHHFACTGGTLISKCVAALPNVVILNEIDPLSKHVQPPNFKAFAPRDLISDLHHSIRPISADDIGEVFAASVVKLRDLCERQGRRVVMRDHALSQYCTTEDYKRRPTVRAMLQRVLPLRSIVTVRHPLEFLPQHVGKQVVVLPAVHPRRVCGPV